MKTMGTAARGDDLVASYSSKGPTWIDMTVKPDLVAPGNQVVSLYAPGSTLARTYPQNAVPVSSYSTAKGGKTDYFTQPDRPCPMGISSDENSRYSSPLTNCGIRRCSLRTYMATVS